MILKIVLLERKRLSPDAQSPSLFQLDEVT